MAVNLNIEESESREKRLGSITGYHGTLKDMVEQNCAGCLKDRSRCFTTGSCCSHSRALDQLAGVRGTVVVDHAPVGCSGSMVGFSLGLARNRRVSGEKPENTRIFSTNIREADTIFGASEKLRQTIREAYDRYHPAHMFVVTSCVAAIIGEDAGSVIEEMEEELGIPIGFAPSPGFKSKIWASGFDGYCHAVSRKFFKEPEQKKKVINYVGFSPKGRDYIEGLFKKLGYDLLCITGGASQEMFEAACASSATFGQCGAQSSYLCGALEQQYGIKYFQQHLPYGGIGWERFFQEIGDYLGQGELASQIIAEERSKYELQVARLKSKLQGKRVFIALGASFAYEYTRICKELGMEVVHTVAYHYDPQLDNESGEKVAAATDVKELDLDVPTSVNDAQEVETFLTLKHNIPDLVISRAHSASYWAAQMGIPALEVIIGLRMIGYKGLVHFGERVWNALNNQNFVNKVGAHFESPFSAAYEEMEPFSFYEEANV